MKNKRLALVIFILPFIFISGCQALKKKLAPPPPEGIQQESYAVEVTGYEQTVTVDASPFEVAKFITDTSNWITVSDLKMGESKLAANQGETVLMGSSFPLSYTKLGVKLSGQMITVKIEDDALWFVWDNPSIMQTQRWTFKPAGKHTQLTIRMETEKSQRMAAFFELAEVTGIVEQLCKEVDAMLAGIQYRFDQRLDPKELTSHGLRGKMYDSIFQAHRVSTWIDATPDEVINWLFGDPKNLALVVTEVDLESTELDISSITRLPQDQTMYDRLQYKVGTFQIPGDTFFTRLPRKNGQLYHCYMITLGNILRIEVDCVEELSGSRLTFNIVSEVPGSLSSESMELMMSLVNIPKRLVRAMTEIKSGVEGVERERSS